MKTNTKQATECYRVEESRWVSVLFRVIKEDLTFKENKKLSSVQATVHQLRKSYGWKS